MGDRGPNKGSLERESRSAIARIALLQPAAVVDLSGDGAAFVKAQIVENTGAPALVIRPRGV